MNGTRDQFFSRPALTQDQDWVGMLARPLNKLSQAAHFGRLTDEFAKPWLATPMNPLRTRASSNSGLYFRQLRASVCLVHEISPPS